MIELNKTLPSLNRYANKFELARLALIRLNLMEISLFMTRKRGRESDVSSELTFQLVGTSSPLYRARKSWAIKPIDWNLHYEALNFWELKHDQTRSALKKQQVVNVKVTPFYKKAIFCGKNFCVNVNKTVIAKMLEAPERLAQITSSKGIVEKLKRLQLILGSKSVVSFSSSSLFLHRPLFRKSNVMEIRKKKKKVGVASQNWISSLPSF